MVSGVSGGYSGHDGLFGRRARDGRWWIAGFNGEAEAKTIEVSLAELKLKRGAALELITDATAAGGGFARREVTPDRKTQTLKVELKPGGGFAATAR